MIRYSLFIVAFFLAFPTPSQAGRLLSPVAAERLGLVESWHRQLSTIGGEASIVDIQVWVQGNTEIEYVEVVRAEKDGKPVANAEVLRRIPTNRKNASGLPIGKPEAERLAKLDVLKLKRRGIDAAVQATKVKQVRLYLLTEDGGLSAYDAETGETLWSIRLGKPNLGYGSMGISDQFVTVINGTTMYRVIADDRKLDNSVAQGGRPLEAVRLDSVPVIGATNTDTYVVVPNARQGIECYTFEDQPAEPNYEVFAGQALVKPTRFPASSKVAWTTDRGFFYVMDTAGTPSTLFRLKTDGNVAGGPTAGTDDRFYLGSSGGRVYCVTATRSGEVTWNRSFGEPFYSRPYVTPSHVVLASSYGNLFALDARNGDMAWAAPVAGLETVFSRIGDHYFARTTSGQLAAVSVTNGQLTRLPENPFVDQLVVNRDTDRLYLISSGGTVQCLRPAAAELPTFYRDQAPASANAPAAAAEPGSKEPANPFGVAETAPTEAAPGEAAPAEDPFGAAEPMSDADPFGAGADPFGAGAGADAGAGAAADPFGAAGNNPF